MSQIPKKVMGHSPGQAFSRGVFESEWDYVTMSWSIPMSAIFVSPFSTNSRMVVIRRGSEVGGGFKSKMTTYLQPDKFFGQEVQHIAQ